MTTKTLSLVAASLLLTQISFAETVLEDITVVSATKDNTKPQCSNIKRRCYHCTRH